MNGKPDDNRVTDTVFFGCDGWKERCDRLRMVLDEAFMNLSALQQPDHPMSDKEAEELREWRAATEVDLLAAADEIVAGLCGKESHVAVRRSSTLCETSVPCRMCGNTKVIVVKANPTLWNAYCNSCGQNESEASGATEDEAIMRWRLKQSAKESVEEPGEYHKAADVWRAAMTLAHNICVQESDRLNDDDGNPDAIQMASTCAGRIRGWLDPDRRQIKEMLLEANCLVVNDGSWGVSDSTLVGKCIEHIRSLDKKGLRALKEEADARFGKDTVMTDGMCPCGASAGASGLCDDCFLEQNGSCMAPR